MAKTETVKQPQYYTSRINTRVLNYHVYIMSAGEKLLYSLLTALLGGVVGLIFYGGLFKSDGKATLLTHISDVVVFVVVALLAVKMFLPIINDMLRARRLKKLRSQFCDFASAMTNALGSGMNIQDAIGASYRDLVTQYSEEELIVQEVREIIAGMQNNIPIEDMIADFGIRSGIGDIENFAIVFTTCFRTGGNIKSVVRRTTEVISEKLVIAGEIETTITSNKLQMTIMNVIPIVLMLILRGMSDEFAESFATILGVVMVTIAAAMFVAAYKWGRKITNIEG